MIAHAATFAWGAAAALGGAVQAHLLARAASRPLAAIVRLVLVATILTVAATQGQLLGAILGWIAGFAATSVVTYRALPGRKER